MVNCNKILVLFAITILANSAFLILATDESSATNDYVCRLQGESIDSEYDSISDAIAAWNNLPDGSVAAGTKYYSLQIYGGEYVLNNVKLAQHLNINLTVSPLSDSESDAVTLKNGSNSNMIWLTNNGYSSLTAGEISFEGLDFVAVPDQVSDGSINFFYIKSYGEAGFHENVSHISFEKCSFEGSRSIECLALSSSSGSQTSYVSFNNCRGNNMAYLMSCYCENITVTNTTFTNCKAFVNNQVGGDGITTITNCTVDVDWSAESNGDVSTSSYVVRVQNGGDLILDRCVFEYELTKVKENSGIVATKNNTTDDPSKIELNSCVFLYSVTSGSYTFADVHTVFVNKVPEIVVKLNGNTIEESAAMSSEFFYMEKSTIELENNGGSGQTSVKINKGGMVYKIDIPTKTGCRFDGYYDATYTVKYVDANGIGVERWTDINDDNPKFYAKWFNNSTYTVTYDFAGGEGPQVQPMSMKEGETFVTLSAEEVTKEGYVLKCWSDENNGGRINPGKDCIVGTSNIVLRAVWEKEAVEPDKTTLTVTVKYSDVDEGIQGATVIIDDNVKGTTGYGGIVTFNDVTKEVHSFKVIVDKDGKVSSEIFVKNINDLTKDELELKMSSLTMNINVDSSKSSGITVVVGNLSEVAGAEEAEHEVDLDVYIDNSVAKGSELSTELKEIKDKSGSDNMEFFDVTILCSVDGKSEKLTETGQVVELCFKFNSDGKTDIKVLKYHDGQAKLLSLSESKDADTYYIENGWIHIFSDEFSPFAITYNTGSEPILTVSELACCIIALSLALILVVSSYDYVCGKKQ